MFATGLSSQRRLKLSMHPEERPHRSGWRDGN